MEERCEYCKYCHLLKEFKDKMWTYRDVCTVFPQTEQGYDAFAIIVTKDDRCENFARREQSEDREKRRSRKV